MAVGSIRCPRLLVLRTHRGSTELVCGAHGFFQGSLVTMRSASSPPLFSLPPPLPSHQHRNYVRVPADAPPSSKWQKKSNTTDGWNRCRALGNTSCALSSPDLPTLLQFAAFRHCVSICRGGLRAQQWLRAALWTAFLLWGTPFCFLFNFFKQ